MARAVQTADTRYFQSDDIETLDIAEAAAVTVGGRSLAILASQRFGASLLAVEALADGTLAPRVLADLAGAPIPAFKVEAVSAVSLGDRAFVLVVDELHVATVFELFADLTLAPVDAADVSDEVLATRSQLFAAHGTLFLAFERLFADDVIVAAIDPDAGFGAAGPATLAAADIGGDLQDIAQVSVGPRSFLYVATRDGVAVAEVARDGAVSSISTAAETPGAAFALLAAEVDGRAFLIATDRDALRSHRVEHDGSLTLVQTLDIDARSLALAEEDGRSFVLAGGRLLELGGNGLLLDLGAVEDRESPAPNADFTQAVGFSGPAGAVFVEALNEIDVSDGASGFATRVEVVTGPNLTIDPDAPLTLVEGVRLPLGGTIGFESIGVTNTGDAAATDYGISVFVSLNAAFDAEAELLAGVAILRTEAGAAIGGVGGRVASQVAVVGDAFLHVFVDPLGEVDETDETDNLAAVRVQVTPFSEGADAVTLPGASAFDWLALGGDDTVTGSGAAETVRGGEGRDLISGLARSDSLFGGADRDTLDGGGGADALSGEAGRDVLRGKGGADRLDGGAGRDRLQGQSRGDDFVLRPGDGTDVILDFGKGPDRLVIEDAGGRFADLRVRQRGDDTVVKGDGFGAILRDVDADDLSARDVLFV